MNRIAQHETGMVKNVFGKGSTIGRRAAAGAELAMQGSAAKASYEILKKIAGNRYLHI